MKKLKINFVALFCLIIVSCTTKHSVYEKLEVEFKQSLRKVINNSKIKTPVYIVIPRAGCSSCISTVENYMLHTLSDSSLIKKRTFILTDFDSEKILLARFGDLSNNTHVIRDRANVFKANPSLKSIYPVAFMFDKNEKLVKVSEISPQNDGLNDISQFFAKN